MSHCGRGLNSLFRIKKQIQHFLHQMLACNDNSHNNTVMGTLDWEYLSSAETETA